MSKTWLKQTGEKKKKGDEEEGGMRNLPGRRAGKSRSMLKNGLSACEISFPAVSYNPSVEENINISLHTGGAPGLKPFLRVHRAQQGYTLWLLSDHKKTCFLMLLAVIIRRVRGTVLVVVVVVVVRTAGFEFFSFKRINQVFKMNNKVNMFLQWCDNGMF